MGLGFQIMERFCKRCWQEVLAHKGKQLTDLYVSTLELTEFSGKAARLATKHLFRGALLTSKLANGTTQCKSAARTKSRHGNGKTATDRPSANGISTTHIAYTAYMKNPRTGIRSAREKRLTNVGLE